MPSSKPAPTALYSRFSELFSHGFTIDWVTALFIGISHVLCLILTPIAYFYAPEGFWKVMLSWSLIHMLIGCVSTTAYVHRLVSHNATKKVSWPVHIVFGFFGHVLAVQGSVRRWAAMHVVHHSVDRTGKHELDPYSATWFTTGWRNFLWSHMLTYFFHHPDSSAKDRAFESRNETPIIWQDKLYVPLLVVLNFIVPFTLGIVLTGSLLGGFCLMMASVCGFILAQHNTWTVNSVTHMWGFVDGLTSSAKNNFLWMGPLGEGNHHADHHDFARDYRNGFGLSGWLLDPTRYLIIGLRKVGLIGTLRRASKRQEAEIIARRKLRDAQSKTEQPIWQGWEDKLNQLRSEWLDAVQTWESFKSKQVSLKKLKMPDFEMERRLELLRAEMELARLRMAEKKQAFIVGLQQLRSAQFAGV